MRPLGEIVAYFEGKTDAILARYGGEHGNRIHYHAGIVDQLPPQKAPASEVRRLLYASQELMLHHAAEIWEAEKTLSGHVLDVGCGLGGGAIFWGLHYSARVTAITPVPRHAALTKQYVHSMMLSDEVDVMVGDAADTPAAGQFDAAVAFDSSGYLDRPKWFDHSAKIIKPGGHLFVADLFLLEPEYAPLINKHWCTDIGEGDEYVGLARRAGFHFISSADITDRVEGFFELTMRLSDEMSDESRKAHRQVWLGLHNGGLCYKLMGFRR